MARPVRHRPKSHGSTHFEYTRTILPDWLDSAVIRVLYVDLCPSPGGSNISLLHLVSHLDRRQVQPLVALAVVNPFSRFEEAGIPVARIHTPRWERRAAPRTGSPSEDCQSWRLTPPISGNSAPTPAHTSPMAR